MARQRFIWPAIWDDPDLASLAEGAHLLYIGCFSVADDDGRLDGNPVHLRASVFPYRATTHRTVKRWRDEIAATCSNFHIYDVAGREYIQFLNWPEFQKPKYPSPSKLPPPPGFSRKDSRNWFRNDSPSVSGSDSSTGRDGLGREKQEKLATKAAASTKSTSSTSESHYAETEQPGDPAAAVESPTEQDIRDACQRFGADLNIVEPIARQLPGAIFAAVVMKHTVKVARGSAREVPALFVDLLKRELKDQAKAVAKTTRVMPPTRLPEDERPVKVEGEDWVRHIVPTLARHPFDRVAHFIGERAEVELWTHDELEQRLAIARELHQAEAA